MKLLAESVLFIVEFGHFERTAMDSVSEFIVNAFKVVIGIVAFVALMQLFPICVRLGQIRDKLYEQEIAKEKAAKEKAELAQAAADIQDFVGRPRA